MAIYPLISRTENCKNCYKCIRSCPIKAISFENNRANIIHDECILCGTCYNICPQQLKEVRNDIQRVRGLLRRNKVVASVAPSHVAYYENTDISAIRDALMKLGFFAVEETAIGATIVKKAYDEMINEGRDVVISSCCHSINLLIEKRYPECLPFLADVLTPMQAHGLNIRERFGDVKVVFIGPCISKKDEADHSEYIDAALTFEELDRWLKEENIDLDTEKKAETVERSRARLFPKAGGIIDTMMCEREDYQYIVVDGLGNCMQTLEDIRNGDIHRCFIEMSACEGSCINGPVTRRKKASIAARLVNLNRYAGKQDFEYGNTTSKDIHQSYQAQQRTRVIPTEEEIERMLNKMHKAHKEDRLNCGCCGYDSCHDKAIAIIQGRANIDMCLPLLMEKSQSLSDTIVRNSPNGLMVLDEELSVQLMNRSMCRILGLEDVRSAIGQHVAMVMDPTDFYESLDGRTIYAKREYLAEYDRYVEKTIGHDSKFKVLVCVMKDITEEEKSRKAHKDLVDNTITITDSLLEQNMTSVHEIASLLGDTVAETKVALEKLKKLVQHDD
ncbi:MAG: 4Fe-4S dicluster domain-containing protein [Erysipelotrichaceae bacterium]|nr:4Fe-4S dicluster domain-containing protein [Erysipelotrichaceae bacterium]